MKAVLILGRLPEDDDRKALYKTVISVCKKFTTNISSPIDTAEFKSGDAERYGRAFEKVREADFIIGELSQHSTGQGMELREAATVGKPIIIIAKAKSKVSGMVKGCPSVKEIIFYRNPDDLKEKLINTLQKRL